MQHFSVLPASLRPRERLVREGAEALDLDELIAVIIGSGTTSVPVSQIAQAVSLKLLYGQGSLEELQSIPGIGRVKALEIIAALQIGLALKQKREGAILEDAKSIYEHATDLLDEQQEHLVVFFLTARNAAIKRQVVSIGTVSASLIHPREVFRSAILNSATHIVLAHNHPSGNPFPSSADSAATKHIAEAGKLLGIQLVDHVICARKGFISLRNEQPELF